MMAPVAALLLMVFPGAGPLPAGPAARGSARLERFALEVVFLAARRGTRILARHRLVLRPGMEGSLEQAIPRRIGGALVNSSCHLLIRTAPATEGVGISLEAVLRPVGQEGDVWRRRSHGQLRQGTSMVLELAPADQGGERLVLSVTLEEAAPDEPLTARAVQVEMRIKVTGVEGEQEILLHEPHLRTLSGRWAEFAFDYPVPAAAGGGVDHVRMALRVRPGYPRQGKLPLEIDLTGDFPTSSRPLYFSRAHSALLRPEEIWQDTFSPPGGAGPSLRLSMSVVWASF